jgi:L-amino acid N-acyltransferase YncA
MITIRETRHKDYEEIWQIFHEVVSVGDTYPFSPDTDRKEALRLWVEMPRETYVAKRDGQVIGTYYIKTNQPGLGSHVCNAGYMVRSEARGQGVGKAMCAHSLDEARRMGYRAMQYNLVAATNIAAVKLWQQMGFAVVGTLPQAFNHAALGLVGAHVMYRLL